MSNYYHYTTIETLALILKSKKLRFTRLDLVDDILEVDKTKFNVSTHYFISCWTLEDKESIPLWKDRDSRMRGIRIVTNFNPVKIEIIQSIKKPDESFETPILNGGNVILDKDSSINYLYWHPNKDDKAMKFHKMNYFENKEDFINAKIKCVSENETLQEGLVLLKMDYWQFQNEYRLIVPLIPMVSVYPINEEIFLEEIQKGKCHFKYFDFDLKEEFINNIEITLGPLCSESDEIIVESLLKNYTSNGRSSKSELTGKIRRK